MSNVSRQKRLMSHRTINTPSMKPLAVAAMLMMLADVSIAAVWVGTAGNNSVSVSVDRTSMVRNGAIARAWTKWVFAQPADSNGMKNTPRYRARLLLSDYNCSDRSTLIIQSITFTDEQMTTALDRFSAKDFGTEFALIPPDSINEALLNFSCSQTKP